MMLHAYMRSVHDKSFKLRLYIVFRQLFSSAFVKCKSNCSFKLLCCCNCTPLTKDNDLFSQENAVVCEIYRLTGEIINQAGTQARGWMLVYAV